ncbi:MAG: hypothetical protein H7321_10245, partial [Bacteroidia bacterium]|nr:hypothetical protein [Bacteroidia bacterium]
MKLKLIPALAVILLLPVWLSAQNKSVPLGSWRVHLPYQNCKLLTETPDKIYAASEVGFFSLKKNGGESEQLSTINGFTDITISAIKYDFAKDIMVIAYEDCRFDVIKGKDIYPNDDIFRKNILGVKQVNHLYFQQNLVYFSTSFGIVVFDLDKMEIFDSYLNIGPSGSTESINSLTVSNDTIFAATARGVIFGKVSPSVNLSDFNNWKMYRTGSSMHVESFNKKLFADFNKVVYVNENGTWQPYTDTFKKVITNIEVNHNKLVVAEWGGITVEDMNGNAVVT